MQTDPATPMSEMPPMGTEAVAAAGTVALLLYLVILIVFYIVICIGCWKMVAKAGMPGILGLIPIVNLFVLPIVAGKPWWWAFMIFIPIVGGLLYMILVSLSIAERFGRGIGTVLGLIFLTPIFVCILGFGDAEWSPPTSSA
ncbi:MAG: signal peptidase I [Phycisphaeraceae bacterium]|nr:signal peptidase I [Phycisphaeraceae bacterium]